jgi:hypothetical protein
MVVNSKNVTMVKQPDGIWRPNTKEEHDEKRGFFLAKAREVVNQARKSQREEEENKRNTTPWRSYLLKRPIPLPASLSQSPTSPASKIEQGRKSDEDILLKRHYDEPRAKKALLGKFNKYKRTAPLSSTGLVSYPSSEDDSDEPFCKPFGKKHRFLPCTPPETPPYLSPISPCTDLGDDSYSDDELPFKESGRRAPLRATMTVDEIQHCLVNRQRTTTSSLGHCDHPEPCASPAECFLKYMDKHYTADPAPSPYDHTHNNTHSE